jgi:hypothetical protein
MKLPTFQKHLPVLPFGLARRHAPHHGPAAGVSMTRWTSRDWAGATLFAAAVCVFLYIGLFNLGQPVLEQHSFRQTQTALTAYWLRINGFSLAYETPVVGFPWAIPFEFPLFQLLAAWTASLTGLALDPAGRLVSLLASLAVCLPLYRSLRLLGVEAGAAWYANALYLTAPTYLFWSGTFMIEGLALLLALGASYYLLKIYRRGASGADLALFCLLLTLALLQKVTTGAVPVLVGLAAFGRRALADLLGGARLGSPGIRHALAVLAAAALAFAIGYAWVRYTDAVKQHNEFGRFLTSAALSAWNYGTVEQRFSKEFLVDVLVKRILVPSSGWCLAVLALVSVFFSRAERPLKITAALGLVLFLLPMAIFTNLHFVHDYYQTANLVYLMAALGVAVYAWCALLPGRLSLLAPLLMTALLAANLHFFRTLYYPTKSLRITVESNRTLKLAAFLKSNTPADRPILIFGYDWSSEVSYYAERKGLAVPPWTKLEMEAALHPERFLPVLPAAIVSCPAANAEELRAAITARYAGSAVTDIDDCRVHLPRP